MNCILAIRTFDTLDTLLNKIKRKEEGRKGKASPKKRI